MTPPSGSPKVQDAQPHIQRRLASGQLVLQQNDAGLLRLELAADRMRLLETAARRAEADLGEARAAAALAASDLAIPRLRVDTESARRRAERAEALVERLTPLAPAAGLVVWQSPRPGTALRPGEAALTLYDPRALWVSVAVEESLIGDLAPGSRLAVEIAGGRRTEAAVESVSAAAAFATQRDVDRRRRDVRAFEVRLRLPPETIARPGMTAYVELRAR